MNISLNACPIHLVRYTASPPSSVIKSKLELLWQHINHMGEKITSTVIEGRHTGTVSATIVQMRDLAAEHLIC